MIMSNSKVLHKVDYDLDIDYGKLMEEDWASVLKEDLLDTLYMENLMLYLHERYKTSGIFPKKDCLFKPFNKLPFKDIRVVVLGREPFADGQATGIPLGNEDNFGTTFSPELITWNKGIELSAHCGFNMYSDPTLQDIISQGVFLMDTALTSELGKSMAHKTIWKNFTREVIKTICDWHPEAIFVLLGKEAKKFAQYIPEDNYTFYSNHPYEAIKENKKFDASFTEKVNAVLKVRNGRAAEIIW